MSDLLNKVAAFVAAQELWQPGAMLLVAVSGGPDSLCLLHLLKRLAPGQHLRLHVAHLDHGLRPDSSDDARFVAETAAGWGIAYTVERREVARARGGSLEAAARAVRYAFLRQTAGAVNADAVVVGHTADDQAETVVQRLLRGSGPGGLAAMRPRLAWEQWQGIGLASAAASCPAQARASLVRPLLLTPRSVIEAYCAEHKLQPRHDATNEIPAFLRNRVRGYIIPMLKAYNPHIVGALGRTARIAADEDALLSDLLEAMWSELANEQPGTVSLAREVYSRLHRALRRRALRRGAMAVAPDVELGAQHLDRMLELAERAHGRLQLPGQMWMQVTRRAITLQRQPENECMEM